MSSAIIKWLGGHDTGISSKAIALTALGEMPADHSHPSDGADFGRCSRLLKAVPEARAGLDRLATDGGPYWAALAARWDAIEAVYQSEIEGGQKGVTYPFMRSILGAIEASDLRHVDLGGGVGMRVGR